MINHLLFCHCLSKPCRTLHWKEHPASSVLHPSLQTINKHKEKIKIKIKNNTNCYASKCPN
jgi:hypothetical protein